MFRIMDFYEGLDEVIAIVSDFSEARKIALQRIKDTDGECEVEIFEIETGNAVSW